MFLTLYVMSKAKKKFLWNWRRECQFLNWVKLSYEVYTTQFKFYHHKVEWSFVPTSRVVLKMTYLTAEVMIFHITFWCMTYLYFIFWSTFSESLKIEKVNKLQKFWRHKSRFLSSGKHLSKSTIIISWNSINMYVRSFLCHQF